MTFPLRKAKKLLCEQKQELEALQELSETDRAPVALDQQSVGRLSRMDAMQMQAMAMASERQRQSQIEKINAALRRIDENEYGYCLSCGEDIAEKRLMIDPAALTCIECARMSD